ncbi:four-helix bundle copper-binding protein [soil metagenome]
MPYEEYKECIDACNRCAIACSHCATSCLQEENVKDMIRCIHLDQDCADICQLAAILMARKSDFAERICRVCAEICEACGEECRQHDMDHCQKCADACFECAEKCREMAAA